MPKVALLFLTRGDLYHAELWSRFLAGAPDAFFLAVHAKFPTAIATPWLRDSLCPPTIEGATPADEHYFPGVLSYLGYPPGCPTVRVRPVTFVDWEQREGGHPRTFGRLSEADVRQLSTTSCLFARKFAVDSDVAAYWDRILQGG